MIHLNPRSNLLAQPRQTRLRGPSVVVGITNYAIFCPAHVPSYADSGRVIGYFTAGLVQFAECQNGVMQR